MAYEFTAPEFVAGNSPEEIQMRMMRELPADIDDMPGGFPYDFTMPTALEKSEMIEFHLIRTLMLMFPQYAWEEWLDLHGQPVGVVRKPANHASGKVTFNGIPGTIIPEMLVVCTPATDDKSSIEFYVDKGAAIPAEGHVTVEITAVNAGKGSNVTSSTVTLMAKPLKGIQSLMNEDEISGGTDIEDDESYRERILDYNAADGESFIGNDSDLKRWAKEVAGIGDCIVVPTWNGPGTVKLVLVDSNGRPANERLIQSVYDHILSDDNRENRLLPTGSALLTIVAADTLSVSYSCHGLVVEESHSVEVVIENFKTDLLMYYSKAKAEGVVKYNEVHAVLTLTEGVVDFVAFRMNNDIENIVLDEDEYPEIGEINFET